MSTAQLGDPNAPAIVVRHLWQRLGRFDAVRDLSFVVPRGSVFGFIGPNGAGKTTTIRVLATLTPPTAGRVEICGVDVSRDPYTVRKLIGYMADHPGIYPNLNSHEYLMYFADVCGIGLDRIEQVVHAAMELTGLLPLRDKPLGGMSKGMRQRLQVARILLNEPQVLILDEPASDLDPRARLELRDLLQDLAAVGKSIFLSSHILSELADLCTEVAIVERGVLKASGNIQQIAAMMSGGHNLQLAELTQCQSVRIRLLAPPEVAAANLADLPNVRHSQLSVEGGYTTLNVLYLGGDHALAQLTCALAQRGLGVLTSEPDRNALERIFMQLTHGDLR